MVNQWFRYSMGRMETTNDACSIQGIRQAFNAVGREHPRAARARRAEPRVPQRPPHTGELIIMARRLRFDVSRRRLLQGLGLGAAAGPLIPLLNASAQTAPRPKRLVLLFTPDGAPAKDYRRRVDWKPTGTETDFQFSQIHAPLDPYKAKIVVPWGLTLSAGGAGEQHAYGMAGLWTGTTLPEPNSGASFDGGNGHLTGWGAAPSIDQIVAQAYGAAMPYQKAPTDASPETRYRSIALGVQCRQPDVGEPDVLHGRQRADHARGAARRRRSTATSWACTPSGHEPPMEDPAVTRARAEQHAVVDLLKGDLARIRKRVGTADYQKIDAHLAGRDGDGAADHAAADRRRRTVGCTIPTAPTNRHQQQRELPDADHADDGRRGAHPGVRRHARPDAAAQSRVQQHHAHLARATPARHHTMSHDGMDRRTELTGDRQLVREAGRLSAWRSSTRSTRGPGRCSTTR